jgi:diaminohydroxyphosphoribosylaminopyrimidine deaminase/5-amino-6-(5-phosphoribosylamino)uracil reductase
VFALLQAFRHVPDGVEAARSIVEHRRYQRWDDGSGGRRNRRPSSGSVDKESFLRLRDTVDDLTTQYIQSGGAEALFGDSRSPLRDGVLPGTVTAYVTLEPCCHVGKATPPCASTLVTAGVDRVVVGLRDPNPKVDGGGVQFLRDRGVRVEFCHDPILVRQCENLVSDFCKRISPPFPTYEHVTGAMRASLRTLAAQKKRDRSLAEISWGGAALQLDAAGGDDDNGSINSLDTRMRKRINALTLEPEWMEHLDGLLWQQELVLVRLNQAISKKRYVKVLGEKIAEQLLAHVVQNTGHTVLLYRPGKPAILDVVQLVRSSKGSTEQVGERFLSTETN